MFMPAPHLPHDMKLFKSMCQIFIFLKTVSLCKQVFNSLSPVGIIKKFYQYNQTKKIIILKNIDMNSWKNLRISNTIVTYVNM